MSKPVLTEKVSKASLRIVESERILVGLSPMDSPVLSTG
jgi:hypothetical protein